MRFTLGQQRQQILILTQRLIYIPPGMVYPIVQHSYNSLTTPRCGTESNVFQRDLSCDLQVITENAQSTNYSNKGNKAQL